jgi:hypothetical protein
MMLNGIAPKILLIVVIAFVGILIGVGISTDFFSIQNQDKSLNIHTVNDVLAEAEKYVGQKITVTGYYYQGDLPIGKGYIASDQVQLPIIEGSLDNVNLLLMNYSGVNITLNESALYDFTGTLMFQQQALDQEKYYILLVETIEQL